MSKAQERALEAYPEMKVASVCLDGTVPVDLNTGARKRFIEGYEQATKDTIERAIAWLKEHANEYIVDLTPTYPDTPTNIIVGGMCWEHLKTFLENE